MTPSPNALRSVASGLQPNLLQRALEPMMDHAEALRRMMYLPPPPPAGIGELRAVDRLRHLIGVLDFHFPPLIECQLAQSVNLMAWQVYQTHPAEAASTWASITGEPSSQRILVPTPIAAAVVGISGTGKSQGCVRSLACSGPQVVHHDSFPRLKGSHTQVLYQSIEVPSSGKAGDLELALKLQWTMSTGSRRFEDDMGKSRGTGFGGLLEWTRVAMSHGLAVLHLDEIQNLFRLSSIKARRQAVAEPAEYRIVEDQALKWIMSLTNSGRMAVLVSGTPDGINALSRRLATLQRMTTGGLHTFNPLTLPEEKHLAGSFIGVLSRYQYFKESLPVTMDFAKMIVDLTAGVPRIIMALWIASHRVAFERNASCLRKEDFLKASQTWLGPVSHAVRSLQQGDPKGLAMYEDLSTMHTDFWSDLWGRLSAPN
ncbi:MAG: ATP-binding protein [Mitsuaria chitosanitabida]|uniref:ATP-binding protein n=1 Tax=Roseateles chitosanitabidus TaxID=65048 RepID=UPI001B2F7E90|nr:ATP-binding protein [Roseateles chitosanitabidus]MBO9687094.1 ATP-binding protein [Roseateles chitosanitabidus]